MAQGKGMPKMTQSGASYGKGPAAKQPPAVPNSKRNYKGGTPSQIVPPNETVKKK